MNCKEFEEKLKTIMTKKLILIIFSFALFIGCKNSKEKADIKKVFDSGFTGEVLNIKDAFIEPEKVTSIRLYDEQDSLQYYLNKLDGKFSNLTQISINSMYEGNLISGLPDSITQIKNLKYIYISSNKLLKLPSNIGSLNNLKHLELSGNNIVKIPNNPLIFRNDANVNLESNKIEYLPETFSNSNFSVLNLSNNPIKALPQNFGNLKSLTSLVIDNTDLIDFPHSFSDLKKLKNVSLVNTKIPIEKIEKMKKKLPNCTFFIN